MMTNLARLASSILATRNRGLLATGVLATGCLDDRAEVVEQHDAATRAREDLVAYVQLQP